MIRKATKDDVQAIRQAHTDSIRKRCAGAYTSAQIRAWTRGLTPDRYIRGIEELAFYVAEEPQGPLSGLLIVNEEAGEVCALYVAPWAVHRGLGRRLLDHAEGLLRDRGHRKASLQATLNAVSFYENMGFKRLGASLHELPDGETLPCEAMEKALA